MLEGSVPLGAALIYYKRVLLFFLFLPFCCWSFCGVTISTSSWSLTQIITSAYPQRGAWAQNPVKEQFAQVSTVPQVHTNLVHKTFLELNAAFPLTSEEAGHKMAPYSSYRIIWNPEDPNLIWKDFTCTLFKLKCVAATLKVLAWTLSEVDFGLQKGVTNAISNQFGILEPPETWIVPYELYGAILSISLVSVIFQKFKFGCNFHRSTQNTSGASLRSRVAAKQLKKLRM